MKNINIYNTPFEIGVRILVLLYNCKKSLDLQRIIYYDYLLIHFGDIDENIESLHPSNPFHSTELFIRRKIIQDSLNFMCKKGLVAIECSSAQGIQYKANELTRELLSYFETEYFIKVKKYAEFVIDKFDKCSDKELSNYMSSNVDKWKGEFEKEALFRGE